MLLKLDRPMAAIDIEATGISPRADRIVELAIVRVTPAGRRSTRTFRVNPEKPIPPEATRIHGIKDSDVADCPPFRDIAAQVDRLLASCDLCGYNVLRFDIPMLCEEFLRAGMEFNLEGRRIIDPQRVFHRREPRDLTAALAYYCGEMHVDAHGAEADALATLRVLEAQLQRYRDLPRTMDELNDYCNPQDPSWVDRSGRLKWIDKEVALNFGKQKGTLLRTLIETDPGFIKWILRSDFPPDVKKIVENAVRGIWPEPPSDDASPEKQEKSPGQE
jgi:DNA polymerase-3 subunit epsilon